MWRVWNLLPSSMNRPLPGASVQKPSKKSRKLQSPAATSTPQPPTLTHSAQCELKSLAACSELVKKCLYFVIVVLDNSELHAPDIDTCCSDDHSSSEEVVTKTGSCHTFQHHRNSKSDYWNILSTYQQNLYRLDGFKRFNGIFMRESGPGRLNHYTCSLRIFTCFYFVVDDR